MSKCLGAKIAIKFTEILTGDVSGLTPKPVGIGTEFYLPTGTATANDYYSSYVPSYAFDGSISTFWRASTYPCWLQIELAQEAFISGFRWNTQTTSYRPRAFTVQGSTDSQSWEDIFSGESPNENYWKAFSWVSQKAYKYYRWNISTKWSSYVYIYDIELLMPAGNEIAFTITGQEYQYINGPLVQKTYKVVSAERHPDYEDDKHLLLTLHPQGRFNNVEGNLTVTYEQSLGNLMGRGGFVESFTRDFVPTDLVPFPNPCEAETIIVSADAAIVLLPVDYQYGYNGNEILTVTPRSNIELIRVEDIDP